MLRVIDRYRLAVAVLANLALLANQVLAQLPPVTFESPDYVPRQLSGLGSGGDWELLQGAATVTPAGSGYGGGQALCLPVNVQQEAWLKRKVAWDSAETTAFIDFQVKPAADPEGSLATFYTNGTQLAFQVPQGSTTGEMWVYNGSDGEPANPEQWFKTAGTFTLNAGGTAAANYLRVTLRHDYLRNLWDVFVDGKLVAVNLAFDGRGASLDTIEFFGSTTGDTLVEELSAQTQNMLFPDADKDGLPDAWESANGSNPNLYDRESIKPGTGKSFLDAYIDSLWPQGGLNGGGVLTPPTGIPPLTILGSHQPVGAVKGSLSVGGDGSANYAVPIDIPKGTGGMEPRVSLAYSSSAGNGLVGLGWNLTGLQHITRGPSSIAKDGFYDPADFDDSDRFFLDGERLVCVTGRYGLSGSEYRTEIDSFARITFLGTAGNPGQTWKIETKAGLIVTLGATADSKNSIAAGTLAWNVNRVSDTVGNYYDVEYASDAVTGQPFDFINHRVAAIHYTGNASKSLSPYCHVLFDYEERPDLSRAYSTYVGNKLSKRLAKIRVLTGSFVNHSYVLSYTNSFQSGRSLLTSVTKRARDDSSLAVPPTVFEYDGISADDDLWQDSGTSPLSVYNNFVPTPQASSMIGTEDGGTTICLTGSVSEKVDLGDNGVTLHPDSVLQFEFKANLLDPKAAIGICWDVPGYNYYYDFGQATPETIHYIGQGGTPYQASEG